MSLGTIHDLTRVATIADEIANLFVDPLGTLPGCLTCTEADAVYELFVALGRDDADVFMHEHALHDDEGDAHAAEAERPGSWRRVEQ